ncbi:MAG TPA: cation diffusion facilitator family transporter [Pseudolabrys sp.]|nr:cation diffusion facilitator family transporter [Pseudolabrys sp.]
MAAPKSKLVVYAAITGNTLVAITKFIAAWLTGSSAMLSEAVHSVVDTSNQLLLLHGIHRAEKPPDGSHPLGYGRELYFWSFVVALILFTLGAGVTGYEGVLHILNPEEMTDPLISYAVYGAAAIFEGTSWTIALREFRRAKGNLGYYEAVRRSKNPPTFIVLFEDSAALLGLAIAAAGTFAAERLSLPVLDGVASIGIALVLGLTALALGRESKGLLLGEPASRELRQSILSIARETAGIERAQLVFTVHLSPEQVVVALNLEFRDELTAPEIEQVTRKLEHAVREAHPEVIAVFVKPQTAPAPSQSSFGRMGGAARKFGGG